MAERSPLADVAVAAGASLTEEAGWSVPLHFGDPKAEYQHALTGAALFDRSHESKVELTGPDAASFLHNLCTNDVINLPVGGGCEAFLTTAKAKVVAHFVVVHILLHDGRPAYWLDLGPGLAETLIKHLDRYLISEAVEFADRTREFAQLHLAGPRAKAVLETALDAEVPDLAELHHMMRTFGSNATAHVRRHDLLEVPGYDVVFLRGRAEEVWRRLLAAGAKPAGTTAYNWLRLEAGTPVYGVDIDENRFVVEVGRTSQAICYTKGCYLGQEPIVMARDRAGHVNRTLLGLKIGGTDTAPPGAKVLRDGQEVGVVTSSAVTPRFGAIALAYLRRGHQEPGTAVQVAAGAPLPAEVAALPFVTSGG